ncbi:lytic transglycosylase domain-containing protein [Croceicoccus sp. YJ47]|uniref:lytic transglycosylase domain-containing protein n=1 Tax=Croceicoccus sp. YJ47 TaxID=2798724 RepID=UPI001F289AFD|nr:lytic transglycosylase domain-containing protein [Croceicoccus sp. YJ47]
MSGQNPIALSPVAMPGIPADRTRAAIAGAAQATGTDFHFMMAQARIESGLNPSARARTSSATGLYQFIDSTWLATLDRHGEALGYGAAARAIAMRGGRAVVTDPAQHAAIMALRYDPQANALMAGALANDNRAALTPVLGREPDSAELYLAHFLGAGGASRFLTALNAAPEQSAAAVMPQAAGANRAIFYDGGRARSLGEVMGVIRGKMEHAMRDDGAVPQFAPFDPSAAAGPGQPWRMEAARWAADHPARSAQTPAPMAAPAHHAAPVSDMLRTNFALDANDGPGGAHVRRAYARLRAAGL